MAEKIDILRDWFQTVWIRAELDRIESFFQPRAGAEGLLADGQVGPEVAGRFRQLQAGHARHGIVGDHQVDGRIRPQHLQCLGA